MFTYRLCSGLGSRLRKRQKLVHPTLRNVFGINRDPGHPLLFLNLNLYLSISTIARCRYRILALNEVHAFVQYFITFYFHPRAKYIYTVHFLLIYYLIPIYQSLAVIPPFNIYQAVASNVIKQFSRYY